MKDLTVGELKKVLENVPNDTIVVLSSDTGVELGRLGGNIVVESAHYTHFTSSTGEHIKFLSIYANEVMEDFD